MTDFSNLDTYPECQVEVGDCFYRQYPNMSVPDRILVTGIERLKEPMIFDTYDHETGELLERKRGYYIIHGRYVYHTIGPFLERDFCDVIFHDKNWVIEKKGRKAS